MRRSRGVPLSCNAESSCHWPCPAEEGHRVQYILTLSLPKFMCWRLNLQSNGLGIDKWELWNEWVPTVIEHVGYLSRDRRIKNPELHLPVPFPHAQDFGGHTAYAKTHRGECVRCPHARTVLIPSYYTILSPAWESVGPGEWPRSLPPYLPISSLAWGSWIMHRSILVSEPDPFGPSFHY